MGELSQTIISGLVSFGLMVFLLPFGLKVLKEIQVGQKIREDGPKSHLSKEGIPTMGGVLFWPVLLVTTFSLGRINPFLIWTLLVTAGFTLIGGQDDYFKIKQSRSLGLKARQKILFMVLLSGLVGTYIFFFHPGGSILLIPWSGGEIDLGWLIIPFIILVYLASANAVNLIDGLDGLAAGVTGIILIGFAILSLFQQEITGAIIAGSGAGLCLGFLWFNCHPAGVFMGDTGSLMLGSLLASLAVFQQMSLFLLILGGLLVIVTLSVIIQVIYFRLTGGKRIFKMSPLHHHFELSGWPESHVVIRFWLVAVIFTLLGIWGGL